MYSENKIGHRLWRWEVDQKIVIATFVFRHHRIINTKDNGAEANPSNAERKSHPLNSHITFLSFRLTKTDRQTEYGIRSGESGSG